MFAKICFIKNKPEPRDYDPKIKLVIVFLISFAAMVGPMGGSIFLPAIDDIAEDLHTNKGVVNVSYGLYVLSLGIFALWWGSVSEQFGRRAVYIYSFTIYTGFLVGCAMSKSIGMLMAFRILSGAGAAAVQAVGAGTIGDIYINEERGRALGYFYLGPLVGPLVGPLAGGAIVSKWGWQGTQWFLTIISGFILVSTLFFLPETLRAQFVPRSELEKGSSSNTSASAEDDEKDNLEKSKDVDPELPPAEPVMSRSSSIASLALYASRRTNQDDELVGDTFAPSLLHTRSRMDEEGEQVNPPDLEPGKPVSNVNEERPIAIDFSTLNVSEQIYLITIKPLKSLKFLTYPPVLISIIYGSFCFFTLYFLNVSIESLYTVDPYNFKPVIVGLMYIPNSLGYMISSLIAGRWSDRVVKRVRIANNGVFIAEARYAEHVYLGALLYPVALIMFGWTAEKQVFWFVPLIGSFIFGVSSMIIFGTTMTYLVDALPGRGSSGVAISNLVRMVLAAVATFIAQPLQNGMGFGWLYTMLGLIGLCMSGLILLIKFKGGKWRENVNYDKLYS